jgi:NADH:ubiquinone oxidoreductase subunit C
MMDELQTAQTLLNRWSAAFSTPEANRLDVKLTADDLLAAVGALSDGHWGYLGGITGLDGGVEAGEIEALYHFCAGAVVVSLRIRAPRSGASLPSICPIVPSASVFEREVSEMLGVTFVGTPDPSRLFLPDDWPDGIYPLLKDAPVQEEGTNPHQKE